jgi:hypothetical protein
MTKTTIRALIILAATVSFVAGLLFASCLITSITCSRVQIHDCQNFLESEKFDTIAETLQNKFYHAPKF